jgi:bleomycin hydrolase
MNSSVTRIASLALLIALSAAWLPAQNRSHRDNAHYEINPPSYFRSTILPSIHGPSEEDDDTDRSYFKADLSDREFPNDPALYTTAWHTSPVSQGQTNTCWCYATTFFYESEIHRVSGREIRLSEMFTVYWEYVERAKYFVAQKGEMYFGEGSETNAVGRMMEMYGTVPHESYPGVRPGQTFPTHARMFEELQNYMELVRKQEIWKEEEVVSRIRSIMDRHMGPLPEKIKFEGKKMTPLAFLEKEVNLNMGDYVHFMSLMEHPYFQKAEYEVPDNWWHSGDYNNVPLDNFMDALKSALKAGYSVAIGGDVSEAGLVTSLGVGIVPTFDIPSAYIDENARQLRFQNGATTDDHAMHVVGYTEKDGETWFLVKDSGAGSRNCGEGCKSFGYYFFHQDYVKLKMMNFTVHRDAVSTLLSQMNAQ